MKYKFLEHTSDLKFKSYGENLEELFSNAHKALNSVLTSEELEETEENTIIDQRITISCPSLDFLIVQWLEEILFFYETHNLIFVKTDLRIKRLML